VNVTEAEISEVDGSETTMSWPLLCIRAASLCAAELAPTCFDDTVAGISVVMSYDQGVDQGVIKVT